MSHSPAFLSQPPPWRIAPSSSPSIAPRTKRHCPPTCASILDSVSDAVKLNAVAESMARSRDVDAALAATAELRASGAPLQPRTVAAIVDAITARPGPNAHVPLSQLFMDAAPRGFGLQLLHEQNNIHINNPPTATKAQATSATTKHTSGLPDAQRGSDIALAVSFSTIVASALTAEAFEPLLFHHPAPEATTVLLVVAGALVYDRFGAAGHLWNKLSAGMDRLLTQDPAREARVDAAFFLVAYLLGLPFAPFRPDPAQVLSLHALSPVKSAPYRKRPTRPSSSFPPSEPNSSSPVLEPQSSSSSKHPEATDDTFPGQTTSQQGRLPVLDNGTIDRYLIWFLAGAAAEAEIDGRLIESDASTARAFLRKAVGALDEPRMIRAYVRARQLLAEYQPTHAKLAENMLRGLSAGQCITLLDTEFA